MTICQLQSKTIMVDDKLNVVLFALNMIASGTELSYDYGGYIPWQQVMLL